MRWDSVSEMNCSVARTLSVVGERWTMLILREAFIGRRRFDELQQGTGIARNILSSRLRALVTNGILDRTRSVLKELPDDAGHNRFIRDYFASKRENENKSEAYIGCWIIVYVHHPAFCSWNSIH